MSELERRLDAIAGEDEWTRQELLGELRREGASDDEIHALTDWLGRDDATRRAAARMALAALAAPDSVAREPARAALCEVLESGDEDVRVLAGSALGEAGDAEGGPALVRALSDPAPNVAAAAADALGELRYGPATEPLIGLAESTGFWARTAAIVALGQLRDERALPVLERLAAEPALVGPVVEAVERINQPEGLATLRAAHRTAPRDALHAAGTILAAHPELPPPAWVGESAAEREDALTRELIEHDDPALARLLGLTGSSSAVHTLLDLVGPPRRSEAAIAGLLAVPEETRTEPVLRRLEAADRRETLTLLSLLPPVRRSDEIQRLVPLLSSEDETVRAAVAEALARAPVAETLPVLAAQLDREGVAPEVIRALGWLGEEACASLVPLLRDPSPDARAAAAAALSRCADQAIEADLRAALETEEDPDTRHALLRAVARAGGVGGLDALDAALDADDLQTRLAAIEALGLTAAPEALPRLERALDRSFPEQLAALRALGDLALPQAEEALLPYLAADDVDLRRAAAHSAVRLGSIPVDAVVRLADDADPWVRTCAARLLARPETAAARDRLDRMAERDPDPEVRAEARRALRGDG